MTRVRLTRKLAPMLNGVDLSKVEVGDDIQVPEAVAAMLIREGWAEQIVHRVPPEDQPASASR